MLSPDELAKAYRTGELCGWAEARHPGLAKEQFRLLSQSGAVRRSPVRASRTFDPKGGKYMLYQVVRQVIGKDTDNYPQEIGDPFAAGTMVLKADRTEQPVETLRVGDRVLNHLGETVRVTKVIKRNFTGRMVEMRLDGWHRRLVATESHHSLRFPDDGGSPDAANRESVKFGELRVGDWQLTPLASREYAETPTWSAGLPDRVGGGLALAERKSTKQRLHGTFRRISSLRDVFVENHDVYCIMTEGEYTAVFNGVAQRNCVSFGAKNGAEYLECSQILAGAGFSFRPVFPPYYYGTGRLYVGKGQIGGEDGSLGVWMAEAVQKYGTLFSDEPGVPRYSGRVAAAFGDRDPRDLDKWKPTALPFLIRDAVQVNTWEESVDLFANGYAQPTASSIGYSMEPGRDGFHAQTDQWNHQMCAIGICDDDRDPYVIILNSWGDAHGRLKDFDDGHDLPVGVLRVRRRDWEKHLRAGETYAYSHMLGFPENDINKKMFDLLGKD